MELPAFKYHPDPLKTGAIASSDEACACCGERRGFVYTGPVHSTREVDASICPWCIGSGEAHERFEADFTDTAGIGSHGVWTAVAPDIVREVAHRTPGFRGLQQARWWTHCGDAAEFLGHAGAEEVIAAGPALVKRLREDLGWPRGGAFDRYVGSLRKTEGPTAYLFRCLHCGQFGGYSDAS
jgi:hypothetical protein